MIIDLTFESNYSIVIPEELGDEERYYFPSGSKIGGRDGLIVKINSNRDRGWIGIFEFGQITINGISGIYSMPNPDQLCVISKGSGYIISAKDPTQWERANCIPVLECYPVSSNDILIMSDYTDLTAYDRYGIKWTSVGLANNGFKIIEVTAKYLTIQFWSLKSDSYETSQVDLLTGLPHSST